jgi:hypothetical protein
MKYGIRWLFRVTRAAEEPEKILRMIHVKYASIFFNLLVFKKAFALTQSKPELRMASHALDV